MRTIHRSWLPAALAAATLAVAACGTTEDPETSSDSTAASDAGPVSVTDERGTVELDAPAVDVVSLEWGLTEDLVALGVDPAGQADVKGYNTWNTVAPIDADTPDVGMRGEPSLDAIAALEPDLVVTTTDVPENVIAQIEEVAPVLALRGSDSADPLGYMRRTIETLSEATGTEDAAEDLLAEFDAKVQEGKQALSGAGMAGSEFTMADGWITNGTVSIRMYTEGSYFGALGESLGLVNAWAEEGDPDYGLAQTDVEGLTKLGDVQFIYAANDADGGDPFVDGLADNAVWTERPFVAASDVHRIPDGIWMFGGPRSGEAYVDAVVDALTK